MFSQQRSLIFDTVCQGKGVIPALWSLVGETMAPQVPPSLVRNKAGAKDASMTTWGKNEDMRIGDSSLQPDQQQQRSSFQLYHPSRTLLFNNSSPPDCTRLCLVSRSTSSSIHSSGHDPSAVNLPPWLTRPSSSPRKITQKRQTRYCRKQKS